MQTFQRIGEMLAIEVSQQAVALHLQVEPVRFVAQRAVARRGQFADSQLRLSNLAQRAFVAHQFVQLADEGLLVLLGLGDIDEETLAAPAYRLQVVPRHDDVAFARQ